MERQNCFLSKFNEILDRNERSDDYYSRHSTGIDHRHWHFILILTLNPISLFSDPVPSKRIHKRKLWANKKNWILRKFTACHSEFTINLPVAVPFIARPLIFENPRYMVSSPLRPISNYINWKRERKLVSFLSRSPFNEKLMALLSEIPEICDVIGATRFLFPPFFHRTMINDISGQYWALSSNPRGFNPNNSIHRVSPNRKLLVRL